MAVTLPIRLSIACVVAMTSLGAIGIAHADDALKPTPAQLAFFETKIRPVLVEHCYECHSADAKELQGGLLADSRDGLLAGGETGPAVVPGKPAESLLIEALKYESYEMPPAGKLPDKVIADFEKWIEMGMPDPRTGAAPVATGGIDLEEGRKFWCFQPVERYEPPAVDDQGAPLGDIDRFLLARLQEKELDFAPEADRATWLRRVTFDLVGLPPTPEEVDAFVADQSENAYEAVVDRLLASPHFGERWGRHWLDVARFAESSGGGRSIVFKDAWRYRDYVIDSVNGDKPVDEFIVEQIAGDLLPYADEAEEREHLIATAYLLLGAHNYEEQDKKALEMDVVDEQLDAIGRGLLGMTLACARCHDHKFDPVPTADYYALAGILKSTRVLDHENVSKWTTRLLPGLEADAAAVAAYEKLVATDKDKLAKAKVSKRPIDAKRVVILEKRLAGYAAAGPPVARAMAVEDAKAIEDCQVCIRGSVHHRGPAIPRGFLQVAMWSKTPALPPDSSGRLELARWIASPDNPLTARVYVNRVWQYLFGYGLVRTADNFGTTGELPSHPELLDSLARSFVDDGWSTKRLVRRIVLSRAYRMASKPRDEASAVDPENRLLWRANHRRLDAESLRDAMLMASGQLDLKIGGLNILDKNVLEKTSSTNPAEYDYKFTDVRRSVYTPGFRNRMHELFETFDFADQNSAVGRRNETTAAPQALLMLNSPFVMDVAHAAAERMFSHALLTDLQRIDRAFRETLGRPPTPDEATIALAAVGDATEPVKAWEQLYQALFGSIDFRYIE